MSDTAYFSFERPVADSVSVAADHDNHRVVVSVVRFDNASGNHSRSSFTMSPDEAWAFASVVQHMAEAAGAESEDAT